MVHPLLCEKWKDFHVQGRAPSFMPRDFHGLCSGNASESNLIYFKALIDFDFAWRLSIDENRPDHRVEIVSCIESPIHHIQEQRKASYPESPQPYHVRWIRTISYTWALKAVTLQIQNINSHSSRYHPPGSTTTEYSRVPTTYLSWAINVAVLASCVSTAHRTLIRAQLWVVQLLTGTTSPVLDVSIDFF